jgi:hypothetical protein
LKGSADFGFEPRKTLIGKARAFDVAVCFGLSAALPFAVRRPAIA